MKLSFLAAAAGLALLAPSGAHAATYVTSSFNTSTCVSTATTTTNACTDIAGVGNTNTLTKNASNLTFTAASGDTSLKMMVTAWQVKQSDNSIVAANIGLYNGGGLGVTGAGDNSGNNNFHTIDNLGGYTDFILLQFNKEVQLDTATLNAYGVTYNGVANVKDTDLSWYNNTPTSPQYANYKVAAPATWNTFIDLSCPYANCNAPGAWTDVDWGTSPATRSLNAASAAFSKIWFISAAQAPTTDLNDAFKLATLTVKATAPVPEPATWAMMIAGFGAIGGTMRRRPRVANASRLA